MIANGHIITNGMPSIFFVGDTITYVCDFGFSSTVNVINQCVFDMNSGSAVWAHPVLSPLPICRPGKDFVLLFNKHVVVDILCTSLQF